MVPFPVVQALVDLSTQKKKDLAAAIGMDAGNFSAAMKGSKAIQDRQMLALLKVLNLDGNGGLRAGVVHLWELGAHVQPLRTVTDFLFPRGAFVAGVWREGKGDIDLRRLLDLPLMAITDGAARVIVRSRGYGHLADPEPVTPETVPALKRLTSTSANKRMLAIPTTRFRAWEKGEVTSVEFDRVLSLGHLPKTGGRSN